MTEIPRVLPALDETNTDFWTAGLEGELRICRCTSCGTLNQPPTPICRVCLSRDLTAEAVSGEATVVTFTRNGHQWAPGADVDYVVAIVELPEQEGLRLTTNIVGCDPAEVYIGMPVAVQFEVVEDVAIPVFAPTR